jgi:IS5 family transposase
MDKLNKKDRLLKLSERIDWSIFGYSLKKAIEKEDRKSNAGRPRFDEMKMFKVLVLQRLYALSDEEMEFQLRDRLTFSRFCGFDTESIVPDEKTIWLYREIFTKAGAIEKLFSRFDNYLRTHGFVAQKGQILDATLVEVPVQRNTEEENGQIKNGKVPKDWEEEPAMLAQKDTDARWTKKNDVSFFGYKNHTNTDVKHKFIRGYTVTPAHVHDSQAAKENLDPRNTSPKVYGDSAYFSEDMENHLDDLRYQSQIHRKAYRNRPLSDFQMEQNSKKSKTRARCEHVYGFLKYVMKGYLIRGVGLARATAKIGLMNLTYNLWRYAYLVRPRLA